MPKINLSLKKFSLMRGGSFLGWGQSAHRDWKIILSVFIVVILFSLIFSFLVFKQINNVGVPTVQSGIAQGSLIDTALLKKIILYYEDQAKKFEKIKSTRSALIDPSI